MRECISIHVGQVTIDFLIYYAVKQIIYVARTICRVLSYFYLDIMR